MGVMYYTNTSDKLRKVNKERIVKKNTLSKCTSSYADRLVHDIMDNQSIFEGISIMDGDKVKISLDNDKVWVSIHSQVLPIWGSCFVVEDCLDKKSFGDYEDFFNEITSIGVDSIELGIVNGKVSNINRVIKKDGVLSVSIGKEFDRSLFDENIEEDWDLVCMRVEDTGYSGIPYTVLSNIYSCMANFINELYESYEGSESYTVRVVNSESELGLYFSVEGEESSVIFSKDDGRVKSLSADWLEEDTIVALAKKYLIGMKRYLCSCSYIEIVFDGLTWKRCRSLALSTVVEESDGLHIKIVG